MGNSPRADEKSAGRARRAVVTRSKHAGWEPGPGRPDPLALLTAQNRKRIASLVPVRWGRMLESPFAFLRGAAAVMAHDLASVPNTGITVQSCGDAHVANFGVFASPERILLFDVNDFDETWPGPFEWDLKRLASSAVVVARATGGGDPEAREVARAASASYRRHMKRYAAMNVLDVWYDRVDADAASRLLGSEPSTTLTTTLAKARRHTSQAALPKLTALTDDGARRIIDHPPLVTHDVGPDESEALEPLFRSYRGSLDEARRTLLDRFSLVDVARKVVGVGSVGTRCYIALLSSDVGEPLFLQVKEADRSVLAVASRGSSRTNATGGANVTNAASGTDKAGETDNAGTSDGRTRGQALPGPPETGPGPGRQGRRVVVGQRLMQADSDIFLGSAWWRGRDYYVRQLRDMKGAVDTATLDIDALLRYLELCGWTLARAHARAGRAATIAGYVGGGSVFDDAIVRFAVAYADQTERDHALLVEAVRSGRIEAETGV